MEFVKPLALGKKAIAMNTATLIIIVGALIFFSFVIFYGWANLQNIEADRASCTIKLLNYCTEWWKNQFETVPYNWADKAPIGCEKDPIKISQPTADDCNILVTRSS